METKFRVTGQEPQKVEVCELNFLAFDLRDRGEIVNSCSVGKQCPKKAFWARLSALLFDCPAQGEPSPGKCIRRNPPWHTHQQGIFLVVEWIKAGAEFRSSCLRSYTPSWSPLRIAMINNANTSPPKGHNKGMWSFASNNFDVQWQTPGCRFNLSDCLRYRVWQSSLARQKYPRCEHKAQKYRLVLQHLLPPGKGLTWRDRKMLFSLMCFSHALLFPFVIKFYEVMTVIFFINWEERVNWWFKLWRVGAVYLWSKALFGIRKQADWVTLLMH